MSLPKLPSAEAEAERAARIEAAMARYLTPAQIRRLGELFAECAVAMVEGRAARLAREAAEQDER